ncbi:MAG: hypothetical protein N2748_04050, partial [candidate division WOR-3 bacterium]|nr:hypothetical protein [candidate division WOR-3 bacterium]
MNEPVEKLLKELQKRFPEAKVFQHNNRRLYISMPKEKIVSITKFLHQENGLRLSIATGIDTREGFEVLYLSLIHI